MARGQAANRDTRGNSTRRGKNGAALVALLSFAAFSSAVLSGCTAMGKGPNANPANLANPTAQESVQINPANLTFSNVSVGQQATQTATLTNTGSQAVSVTQFNLSDPQFTASGISTPVSLAPGQSATFQVSFLSSASGSVSGTLSALTAHGSESSKVKLNGGQAGPSQLSLSAGGLTFGNVLVNGSTTQTVTMKNNGQSNIQISQISVAGAGFSVSGVTAPMTLPAGQSAVLQATFAPTAAGAANGSITITSNAQNPTAGVSLTGVGVAPSYTMSLSPAGVSFGNINVGSTATQTVQLSNTGNSSVTVTQVAASGAGIAVSGLSLPVTLAPSQTVPLTVTYAPTASGATTGSITATNNNGINAVASITGTGVQAALSVTPASASFGSVVTGNTNSQTIHLTNSGTASLTISQASVTGAGFSVSGLTLPLTLAPGQSGNFNAQYAPQAAGAVSGSISIVSNAPNSPATVALSGTGVAATYTISVNPASLSFGSVNDGSTASQSFTVSNTGNSNVAISGVSVTGAGYAILSGGGAVTLSPNQSTSVSVQFAPKVAGAATGGVTIASNATPSTTTVGLSGSGVAAPVSHTVALNWGASTSTVSGYNIYRSSVSGSAYAKVNSSLVGGISFTDSSVTSGQTYYYVATAVDSTGTESVYSNEVSAIVP